MYVEASEACNEISVFDPLGFQEVSWDIKISQLACNDPNLPPIGCLQWFFGSEEGVVQTFNYVQGSRHLANQDHKICVR